MGIWQIEQGFAAFEAAFYSATLTVTASSQTSVTISDASGNRAVFEGTGFHYSGTSLTEGVITSVALLSPSGVVFGSGGGVALDVAAHPIDLTQLDGIGLFLLSQDDRVIGSAARDVMFGAAGNDSLSGRGGRDVFALVGGGQDRMWGGGGADQFVFSANRGTDRIMDFADNGTATDDVMVVRAKLYDTMSISQQGDNVLLDFGASGKLVILNTLVEQIGADDFKVGAPWDWQ